MAGEVELRQIRIFLVLARELHFGRTAERLLLSQARVSQAIRSLEVSVGAPLFERTSRRVALTPAGRDLLERIASPYDELTAALDVVRTTATGAVSGTLRLGLPNPSSGGPHLLEIIQRFRESNPECEVVFVTTHLRDDPLGRLRSGDVDLIALRLPLAQPDLEIGPVLSRERRVLLVASKDPLAARDAIDYDDIGERPVSSNAAFPAEMMDVFIPPVTSTGRVLHRIDNEPIDQLMLRVALGEQVHSTVASWLDHHPHPGVVGVPIRDLPETETALVTVRARRSPRIAAFLRTVDEVLATAR